MRRRPLAGDDDRKIRDLSGLKEWVPRHQLRRLPLSPLIANGVDQAYRRTDARDERNQQQWCQFVSPKLNSSQLCSARVKSRLRAAALAHAPRRLKLVAAERAGDGGLRHGDGLGRHLEKAVAASAEFPSVDRARAVGRASADKARDLG
jgi:hypothetical protein